MFKGKSRCLKCKSRVKESFDFCPFCGLDLRNPEEDMRNYGALGKNEFIGGAPVVGGFGGLGISDKLINSIFNSLVKSLEKQMGDIDPKLQSETPKGIKIKFEVPKKASVQTKVRKEITEEQIKRMANLPRVEAKADVRRLSDRVVYELGASGVQSTDDIFVSKLENGYEVKAIGKSKVYVNSLPVDLPLKGLKVSKTGVSVEFGID